VTVAVTGLVGAVGGDGFTVTLTASGPGVAAYPLVFSFGDGHHATTVPGDGVVTHVYAQAGPHEVVVTGNGYQARAVVTTTAQPPVPVNEYSPPRGPPATGATAGAPGTWTPAGAMPPRDVYSLAGITATPATAWTTGQFVRTRTAGAAGEATWSGTNWVGGRAP
jgi:hypothetical protein